MHNTKQFRRAMGRLNRVRSDMPGASEFDILCKAGSDCDETDVGNADRLIFKYGTRLAYTKASGWAVFGKDGRWHVGQANTEALGCAAEVARNIKYESKHSAGPQEVKDRLAFAKSSGRSSALRGMLEAAAPALTVDINEFDKSPYLWNCPNGTVDLRTGQLLPHDENDRITKMSAVRYNPLAPCPMWGNFLKDVFLGDAEIIDFVQRMIGYAMFGHQDAQKTFFFTGDPKNAKANGSNGKSAFQGIIAAVFGEYATGADRSLIVLTKNKSSINSDVAALAGRRLAFGTEFDRGDIICDRELKRLTGDDTIKARFLHHEYFDFVSQATMMFSSNYMPTINGHDHGIWRRIVILPFLAKFWEAHECPPGGLVKDPKVKDNILKKELEGILAWAVRGAMAYHAGSVADKDGLKVPERLYKQLDSRMSENDPFHDFIETCIEFGSDKIVAAGQLLTAYRHFCEINAQYVKSEAALALRFEEMGVGKDKKLSQKHNRTWRRGAGLNAAGIGYAQQRYDAEMFAKSNGPFKVVK